MGIQDKIGEIRNRVTDKLDEYAEDLDAEREERLADIPEDVTGVKLYVKYWAPELKKAAYIAGVFLAASYGARYGVNLAIKSGRLKVKKKGF